MTRGTILIVSLGVLAMVLLGLGLGFDLGALVIFGLAVGVGLLAVAAARKSTTGSVAPRRCPNCGGLLSPHSPVCKHCLELL